MKTQWLLLFLLLAGQVAHAQIIETIAGSDPVELSPESPIYSASGIDTDDEGNFYFVNNQNTVCKLSVETNTIEVIAGNRRQGVSGDGGPASEAQLPTINDLELDENGNIFISCADHRIRVIDYRTGLIYPVAGNGIRGFSGDG